MNQKLEWQPIETAPKDGTSVLLYLEGALNIIEVGRFSAPRNELGDVIGRRDWRMDWNGDRFSSYFYTPTNWMPLLQPPEVKP